MSNKLQTAAVAFLIFLSTLCSAQSLSETTSWMHNYAAANSNLPLLDGTYIRMEVDFVGCQVTQVVLPGRDAPYTEYYSLADLDPTSVVAAGSVYFDTTNSEQRIYFAMPDGTRVALGSVSESIVGVAPSNGPGNSYDQRFANALKHAILLCGGKPSTF